MTSDHNERIKLKEIFTHPWVKEFESDKEMKEWLNEKRLGINNNNSSSIISNADDYDSNVQISQKEKCNSGNKRDINNTLYNLNKDNINNKNRNKSNNPIINTKQKDSNSILFDLIDIEGKSNEHNKKNKIVKQITLNKTNIQNINDIQKESKEDLKANVVYQHSQSLNPINSGFSLFEDKVFEDTLKIIDMKQKRKIKNEIDSNDIRISKSKQNANDNKNDFFLFNYSNINTNNDDILNQMNNRSDNIISSTEKTSPNLKLMSIQSKEEAKTSQFNNNNKNVDQSHKRKNENKIINEQDYITKDGYINIYI